jgi:hypothetical protein
VITEARSTFPASAFLFKNLTVTSGIDGLQLRGFAIVSNDSAIGRVETRLVTCAKTVAPSACNAGLLNLLTRTDPLPQIPVSAGQQVLITVTITSGTAGTTSAASPAGGTSPR